MAVLYTGPCATITHQVFEVRCPRSRTFLISDLERAYVVRGSSGWMAARLVPVQVCSGVLSGLAGLVVVIAGPAMGSTPVTMAATAGLAASLAVSTVCQRQRRRLHPHEIWAVYQGDLVCLFSTTDASTFAQVRRALGRVLEGREGR